ADTAEDRLERPIARAEHAQRAAVDRRRDRVQRRGELERLHLPYTAGPPAAKRTSTNRAAGHLDLIRLTQAAGRVNWRQSDRAMYPSVRQRAGGAAVVGSTATGLRFATHVHRPC